MNRKPSCAPNPLPRRDCFFGLHQDLHPNARDTALYSDVTEAMVENLLRKVKPDFVQFDCKGHPGYAGYPTLIGTRCPGIAKDALAVWRKATRKYGVGLYVHYSGVYDSAACAQHPDWARVDERGKPDPDATSTFGPYVHELLIPQLKEAADRYDLDGVWVDGECWEVKPDYHPLALDAFRRATGITNVPRKKTDPHWREFIDFQRQQFLRYVTTYVEALHAHRPGFQIGSNCLFSSFHPEPVSVPVDYLSLDVCVGLDPLRFEARYFSSTQQPWDLMDWSFCKPGGFGNADTLWSYKSAVQLQREAAVVLAQGGGFQFLFDGHGNRGAWLDDSVVDLAADVARFCRVRQAQCHRTETVPQVALLLSREDFYHRTRRVFAPWEGEYATTIGAMIGLLACHYSVDVVSEHHLANRLADYPVVVVPEVERLETGFQRDLIRYVQAGGRLLLIGAPAARMFAPLLGVELEKTEAHDSTVPPKRASRHPQGIETQVADFYPALTEQNSRSPDPQGMDTRSADAGARSFIYDILYSVIQKREPPESMAYSTQLMGDRMLAWSPGPWLKVYPKTARPVGYRFPTCDKRHGREVAATLNRVGRGQVAAIYGPLGRAIVTSRHPVLREFLRRVMRSLFSHPLVALQAPSSVELVLRRRGDQLHINLINATAAPRADEELIADEIPFVGPLGLQVQLPRRPRRVFLAPDGKKAPWRWSKGRLTITIPRLDIHTIVIIE